MKQNETMLEYVVRKLNDPIYRASVIAERTKLRSATISEIRTGKNTDPQHSTVERIYKCLKDSEE